VVHFLRILLFSTTIISSLQCMEIVNYDLVNSRQKSKKLRSIVHTKSKKSLSLSVVNTQQEVKEHPLLIATRYQDHDTIKFYLSNRYFNPNVQDLQLNTALHHAAKNRDRVAIELFIQDPRIKADMRNMDNAMARDLVFPADADRDTVDDELRELKRIIFARVILGMTVEQESAELKIIYEHHLLTSHIINRTIDRVKNKIHTMEQQQQKPLLKNKEEIKKENKEEKDEKDKDTNDRELPTSALLPPYATKPFIEDMIYSYFHFFKET